MKKLFKGKNLIFVILLAAIVLTATITIIVKKPKANIEPEQTTTTTSTILAEAVADDVIPQTPADNSGIVVQQPDEQKTQEDKSEVVTVGKPNIPSKNQNNSTTTNKNTAVTPKPTNPTNKVTTTKPTTTKKASTSNLPHEKDLDLTKLPNGFKYIANQGYVATIVIENGKRYSVDDLGLKTVIPDSYVAGPGTYKGCPDCGKEHCAKSLHDWYCVVCKKTIPANVCHDAEHGRLSDAAN